MAMIWRAELILLYAKARAPPEDDMWIDVVSSNLILKKENDKGLMPKIRTFV
jgi:hypothetical protein